MKSKTIHFVIWAAIAAGVVLACIQYFHNRSLWYDETTLALNILARSYSGLFLPLDHLQVAPIGFLLVEKTATLIFGPDEMALRLFPFLCFLASIPLLYFLARELLQDQTASLLSAALFALTFRLIYYSSEAKQYMVDVLFAVLVPYLALRLRPEKTLAVAVLSLAGCVAVFMSNISVISLAIAGIWMAYSGLRRKNFRFLIVFLFWGAAFAVYYWEFIRHQPSRAGMLQFWRNSFLPRNPFSLGFYKFIIKALENQLEQIFQFGRFTWLIEAFAAMVAARLAVQKRGRILLFLLGPLLIHLLLSWLRLYPFYGRFLLYQTPLFILLVAMGTVGLAAKLRISASRFKLAAATDLILLIPLFAMVLPLKAGFPIENEEIKKSLSFYQDHSHNEPLYVYYSSLREVSYYRLAGWWQPRAPLIQGEYHRDTLAAYNPQLDSLKGTVWLVFSHVYPFQPKNNEEAYMVGRLLQNGGHVLEERRYAGSSIYRVATGK